MFVTVPHLAIHRLAGRRPGGPLPWLAVLVAALVLVALPACSSGGDSPTEPGAGGPSAASVEGSLYARLNAERRAVDLPELMLDPVLSEVARRHSERMRDAGFFAHEDPSGSTPASRVGAAGVSFSLLGENLATVTGASDPASRAHGALMGNSEHRNNILEPRYTLVGIGAARSGDSYWMTQIFIRP